jgi:hypothetical protein
MGLDLKSSGDLVAVSRVKQTDVDTPQDFQAASLIAFDEASGINIVEVREDDQDEKTGQVEATDLDIRERSAEGTLTMAKATPDGLGWMSGFFCGNSTLEDTSGGGAATARAHLAVVTSYPENPPYFTAGHRRGGAGGAPADFRRHESVAANTFSVTCSRGEFITASLGVLGTGAFTDVIQSEILSVDFGGVSTGVLANAVEGGDGAPGADNMTAWADIYGDGQYEAPCTVDTWVESTKTATFGHGTASGVEPVLVTYPVKASEDSFFGADPANWRENMEGLTTPEEFRLRGANMQIVLGQKTTYPAARSSSVTSSRWSTRATGRATRASAGERAHCRSTRR